MKSRTMTYWNRVSIDDHHYDYIITQYEYEYHKVINQSRINKRNK